MKIQIIESQEIIENFDTYSSHIVQSTLWGVFEKKLGKKVIYFTELIDNKINNVWMMYITYLPRTNKKLKFGVITQCNKPTKKLTAKLKEVGIREGLMFIKIEPLLLDSEENNDYLLKLNLIKGKDYFLKNTFILNLKGKSEEEVFKNFSTSTRRNIRIAEKNLLVINKLDYIENNYDSINSYLNIQDAVTKRKNFSMHNKSYFYKLYDTLKDNMIVFIALFNNEPVASMVLIKFNNTLYYPYGASMHKYIQYKPSNLLIHEGIKYAIKNNFEYFNFWGALTSNPSESDPLFGVHNFKKGYAGTLHEYVGAYDLVINPLLYKGFNFTYDSFWKVRRLKNKLKSKIGSFGK